MISKVDVYKHAVGFAHANIGVASQKELLTKALAEFNSAGFDESMWEFWNSSMFQVRDRFVQWQTAEKALAAKSQTTSEAKG